MEVDVMYVNLNTFLSTVQLSNLRLIDFMRVLKDWIVIFSTCLRKFRVNRSYNRFSLNICPLSVFSLLLHWPRTTPKTAQQAYLFKRYLLTIFWIVPENFPVNLVEQKKCILNKIPPLNVKIHLMNKMD